VGHVGEPPATPAGGEGAGASPAAAQGGDGYRSRFADPAIDRLFEGILQLRTLGECYRFFEDLCTIGELRALAQRLEVAARLRAGATYEDIQLATGMSSATISRIKRFLLYGADGYRLVLDRLDRSRGLPEAGAAADTPRAARGPVDHPRGRSVE
jgi:TrpR-related protein YerC/YecD